MPSVKAVVRIAADESDRNSVFALRRKIFCGEQGFSEQVEKDGSDEGAEHIIAEVDGRICGCGRIRHFENFSKLERIAVELQMRGGGVGSKIIAFMISQCRARGVHSIKLSAQSHSLGFYRSCGFAAEGEPFEVEGVGHQMMVKHLR